MQIQCECTSGNRAYFKAKVENCFSLCILWKGQQNWCFFSKRRILLKFNFTHRDCWNRASVLFNILYKIRARHKRASSVYLGCWSSFYNNYWQENTKSALKTATGELKNFSLTNGFLLWMILSCPQSCSLDYIGNMPWAQPHMFIKSIIYRPICKLLDQDYVWWGITLPYACLCVLCVWA